MDKDILLLLPEKDYDFSWFLKATGVDKCEVATACKSNGILVTESNGFVRPSVVLNLGEIVDSKYPVIKSTSDITPEIKSLLDNTSDRFVGLHHHDEYSLKDGLGTVENLTKLLKKQRRNFCSVSNHGSIGGWIKQYNACKKENVKSIFAIEAYVSNYRGDDPEQKKLHRSANHILLLAKNKNGFDNIIKIHNDAQLNGFYFSPRANHDAFRKWGNGIYCSTACMASEISRALMANDWKKAEEIYSVYVESFDKVFVEVQIIEFELQRELNRRLIKFADMVKAPLVLAIDSHYLEADHAETHDLLMYMRQSKTIKDVVEKGEDVWEFDVRNLFYRNADQVDKVYFNGFTDRRGNKFPPFKDEVFTEERYKEAMRNTLKIAREIEHIELDASVKLPKLSEDSDKQLRRHAYSGFTRLELDKKWNKKDYEDRLEYELDIVTKTGWSDYFLMIERIVNIAIDEFGDIAGEWAHGPGRGSGAGSLLAWCLGITDVDPLEHGLLFERFLDPGRAGISGCNFDL